MRKYEKNEVIIVRHILGETAESLLENLGGHRFRFKADAWCEGETCAGGFFHLRQAIPVRPGQGHEVVRDATKWPRLRKALHNAGLKPINVPGGDYPLHYRDQIAVPDYGMNGSHYFIVDRKDIKRYLDTLPIDEAGLRRKAEIEADKEARDDVAVANNIGNVIRYHLIGDGTAPRFKGAEQYQITFLRGTSYKYEFPAEDWEDVFSKDCDFDGESPAEIAAARVVILEGLDSQDNVIPERVVYSASRERAAVEELFDGTWIETK